MLQEARYTDFRLVLGHADQESHGRSNNYAMGLNGCGGRCHSFGCSQDCVLEPYHDGPHRCSDHLR